MAKKKKIIKKDKSIIDLVKNNKIVTLLIAASAAIAALASLTDNLKTISEFWKIDKSTSIEIVQFSVINSDTILNNSIKSPVYLYGDVLISDTITPSFYTERAINFLCPFENPLIDLTFKNNTTSSVILSSVRPVIDYFSAGGDPESKTISAPTIGVSHRYDLYFKYDGNFPIINQGVTILSPPIQIESDNAARIQIQLQDSFFDSSATVIHFEFEFSNNEIISSEYMSFWCTPMTGFISYDRKNFIQDQIPLNEFIKYNSE